MFSSPPPLPPTVRLILQSPSSLLSASSSSLFILQNPSFLGSTAAAGSPDSRWVRAARMRHNIQSRFLAFHYGYMRRRSIGSSWRNQVADEAYMFGSSEESDIQVPTQAQSIVEGSGTALVTEYKPIPDIDYLQELLAIQQQGPRAIGFFGTRNMGFMHQKLIEILS